MANIYRNIFSRGLSGAFRSPSVIHRTYSGKTIITNEPMFDDSREFLESLKAPQAAILEATTYANFAKTQAVYLEKELETGMTAYYLAVSDWFGAPRVLEIDVDGWMGESGQTIRVKARDNVKVARVILIIRDGGGNILESGEGVPLEPDSRWWKYTTQTRVLMTPFPTVQAIAQDLPGNSHSITIS